MTMHPVIRRSLQLLDRAHTRRLGLVGSLMVATAIVEVAGVGAVLPFLNMVTDPSVSPPGVVTWLYGALGLSGSGGLLLFTGVGVLVLIVGAQGMAFLAEWAQIRFTWDLTHDLSVEMLQEYMARPYTYFVQQNTSNLQRNVLQEVGIIVSGIFKPGLMIVSKGMVAAAIIGFLLWTEPVITLVAGTAIGGAYAIIYIAIRKRVRAYGRQRDESNEARYRTVSEALGGIKEVTVLGTRSHFVDRYADPSDAYTDAVAKVSIAKSAPSYLMRAVTFGGLMALLLFLLASGRPVAQVVPVIGLFAFAGYRLMPAFESILQAIAQFKFHEGLLDDLHQELSQRARDELSRRETHDRPLPFEDTLVLDHVTFQYPAGDKPALRGINVTVHKWQAVAFAGPTGAGKSTLLDILLGILPPDEGALRVDGVKVDDSNVARWHANLGYIPQEIFLADASIERNIAFGVAEDDIDREAVVRAGKAAHLHDFVTTGLPEGYETMVGERGVRLSGGQRQRIGIARALYRDPDVLILDEATSDIDGETEAMITQAIRELSTEKTLIVVAHRLSTIRDCDVIHVIEEGRITAQGSFDELMATSPRFQAMASGALGPQAKATGTASDD